MIEFHIVLEERLASKMEAIAGKLGIGLEILIVMACQKYVRWVDKRGLPKVTGARVRMRGGSDGEIDSDLPKTEDR